MMILYGGVAVDPARIAEVAEEAAAFQAVCRREEGCIDYLLSWDVAEPNRLRLVEAWESEAAWQTHTGQEHVRTWSAFVGGAAIEPPGFRRCAAEDVGLPT